MVSMGAGFVWLDRLKYGIEFIGREEEVVGRLVGQGGKTSLVNTVDADLLEYVLTKLAARITDKSRTFLVKVKEHRGEPLNEGTDDLAEADRERKRELKIRKFLLIINR